jgi:hypothetical protein
MEEFSAEFWKIATDFLQFLPLIGIMLLSWLSMLIWKHIDK